MEELTTLKTEAMCEKTLMAFYSDLDAGRVQDAVKAFTPDAVWVRMGESLQGAAAIAEKLAVRFPGTVIRHLVSNVVFAEVAGERASSKALVTVYAGSPQLEGAPATLQLRAVVDASTSYERTGQGWRIKSHAGEIRMLAAS